MPRQRFAQTLRTFWRRAKADSSKDFCPSADTALDRTLACWTVEAVAPDLAQRIIGKSQGLAQRKPAPASARSGGAGAAGDAGWWPWLVVFPAAFALGLGLGFIVTLVNLDADDNPDEQSRSASASVFDEEPDRL